MILGRVIGQVWGTKKNPYLQGRKLLLVRPLTWYNPDVDTGHIVCVDRVGAQVGEDVVICLGSPARWNLGDTRNPVDAAIAAIVDNVEIYEDAARDVGFGFAQERKPQDMVTR